MNHKRKRPKSARAGCLWCKPWKHQRAKPSQHVKPRLKRRGSAQEQMRDA